MILFLQMMKKHSNAHSISYELVMPEAFNSRKLISEKWGGNENSFRKPLEEIRQVSAKPC